MKKEGKKAADPHLRAWRALLKAHARAVRRITTDLEQAGGLALESYDVLLELFATPDRRLRLRDLGERVVLTRSGISRLVTRLEREGFLCRESVAEDARGVHACLTSAGEQAFRKTWPLYEAGIRNHFARHLNSKDARRLADILEPVFTAPPDRDDLD